MNKLFRGKNTSSEKITAIEKSHSKISVIKKPKETHISNRKLRNTLKTISETENEESTPDVSASNALKIVKSAESVIYVGTYQLRTPKETIDLTKYKITRSYVRKSSSLKTVFITTKYNKITQSSSLVHLPIVNSAVKLTVPSCSTTMLDEVKQQQQEDVEMSLDLNCCDYRFNVVELFRGVHQSLDSDSD